MRFRRDEHKLKKKKRVYEIMENKTWKDWVEMKRSLMAEVNSDKNIKDRKWKKLNINNGVNI
jgi:hypothetical protein